MTEWSYENAKKDCQEWFRRKGNPYYKPGIGAIERFLSESGKHPEDFDLSVWVMKHR